jgi:hypothetical protein
MLSAKCDNCDYLVEVEDTANNFTSIKNYTTADNKEILKILKEKIKP